MVCVAEIGCHDEPCEKDIVEAIPKTHPNPEPKRRKLWATRFHLGPSRIEGKSSVCRIPAMDWYGRRQKDALLHS